MSLQIAFYLSVFTFLLCNIAVEARLNGRVNYGRGLSKSAEDSIPFVRADLIHNTWSEVKHDDGKMRQWSNCSTSCSRASNSVGTSIYFRDYND